MTQPDDLTRVKHMRDAAQKVMIFMRDRGRDALDTDEVLALAVVRLLEIVGEASKNVSDNLTEKYPEVPWRQIACARDRLTHGYFDVDLDIIWQIVTADLPPLVASLENILVNEEQKG
jgi:uncharacterized protein with HEPN domain